MKKLKRDGISRTLAFSVAMNGFPLTKGARWYGIGVIVRIALTGIGAAQRLQNAVLTDEKGGWGKAPD